jgi:nicotinamide-nucleotide amidase
MNASILSIGDELLVGQVINSNAAFIARQLNPAGVSIDRVVTVGDDLEAILGALRDEFRRCDAVIITGGLGPTHDDITRTAVCRFFETELAPSEEARAAVLRFLAQRNLPWTAAADNQVLVPRGCTVIPNEFGTAPGELFERDGKALFVLPGVPYEMEAMITGFIAPWFLRRPGATYVLHRTLKTTGIAESVLAAKLGPAEELVGKAKLAFLPSPFGVRLRVTITTPDRPRGLALLDGIEQKIRAKAEEFIYGTGEEELEDVVGRMLTERKLTIAVAESCTGGLIADRLTNVPGSSVYVDRGVIAYSNRSKTELLDVPPDIITSHGAVSEEVALSMAEGIRKRSGVDIGLSTTGIAGPGGGTVEKPVGLVWIGIADASGSVAKKFNFGEGRTRVKQRASQAALEMVRRRIR